MKVIIKTLDGQKKPFDLEPEDKVSKVKEMLAEKTGIYVDMLRLIYRGAPMGDDKTLDEHGVKDSAVIHMILQMRGGGC